MSSSWKNEAIKRVLKISKLSEDCIKYVGREKDILATQIFNSLVLASSKSDAPVKLSEIAETLYGTSEKGKQDIIRLTMEKTLLRCGIVEKIYFADRDVRYFPSAYRFQEVRRIESSTGEKIEQLVGEVIELPRKYWPVPKEFFELSVSKAGYESVLTKLESDYLEGLLDPRTYTQARAKLQSELEAVSRRLKEYEEISDLMSR